MPDLGPKSSIYKMLTRSMCFIALWWCVPRIIRLLLLSVARVPAACVGEGGTTGSREKKKKGQILARALFCKNCCLLLLSLTMKITKEKQ